MSAERNRWLLHPCYKRRDYSIKKMKSSSPHSCSAGEIYDVLSSRFSSLYRLDFPPTTGFFLRTTFAQSFCNFPPRHSHNLRALRRPQCFGSSSCLQTRIWGLLSSEVEEDDGLERKLRQWRRCTRYVDEFVLQSSRGSSPNTFDGDAKMRIVGTCPQLNFLRDSR
jgi:hypothetical protein